MIIPEHIENSWWQMVENDPINGPIEALKLQTQALAKALGVDPTAPIAASTLFPHPAPDSPE